MYRNGHLVWYAIHTKEYNADDWGSYNKQKAIKLAKENNATEIVMIDPEDGFCIDKCF